MKPGLKKILIAAAVFLVITIYFLFDAREGMFPQCPFYLVTGLYCPGCGSQRALSAILHGHIFSALQYNLMLILFLPLLVYAGVMAFQFTGPKQMRLWYNPVFGKIVLISILAFWVIRNIPLYPFTILAPGK